MEDSTFMVNNFSLCLFAMAVYAIISFTIGWSVVSYPMFTTGIMSIVMMDLMKQRQVTINRKVIGFGIIFAMLSLGIIIGPHPSLFLVVPISLTVVLSLTYIKCKKGKNSVEMKERFNKNNPLSNLIVSLPSVIILLSFLALT